MRQIGRASWILIVVVCSAGAACTAGFGAISPLEETDPNDRGGGGGSGSCSDEFTEAPPAGPVSPTLEIDTSEIDPFLVGSPATATIRGTVTAPAGIAAVEVGGTPATLEGNAFTADVPVGSGLIKVPVVARDQAGHERAGDRSLLSARFLPEGAFNIDAAALVLTDDILEAMIAPFIEEVANMDIANEVMGEAGALDQSGCTVNLDRVSTGRATIRMFAGPQGDLTFEFGVPDVDVTFHGACDSFIMQATFTGHLTTDVLVRTTIFVPYTGACSETPDHTYPEVELPGYNLDLNIQSGGGGGGFGGGLMDMLMPIIEAIMQGVVKDQLATQIAETADEIIAEQASQFAAFDAGGAFSFAETDIGVGFCLTELGPANGQLRARVGLSAQGPGGRQAPGAPLVEGDLPPASPGNLWVDTNLIGQFMYSLWTSGSFHRDVDGMMTVDMIGMVAPDLAARYCGNTPVTIAIDALIPPLVYAPDPAAGDLVVELGDLMINLVADGDVILGLAANVKVTLDLVPDGTKLMPVVTNVEVDSHVASEPIADVPDDIVLTFVDSQFDAQVQALLGDGGFELPAIGGLVLIPTDVVAEPGGRYLRVSLAP